jgi:hypothetical protein
MKVTEDDDIKHGLADERVFQEALDKLRLRKRAYEGIPHDVRVDLARFCRAFTTCFDPDPRIHAVLEGRREVFIRMQQHWDLQPAQLAELYRAVVAPQGDEE